MNKLIYTLITIITFSCISINANAVEVRGVNSCGEWVSEKEIRRADGLFLITQQQWILGFLSGYATRSNTDILKDIDADSIFLWVDNYCRTNPFKKLDDAGTTLFNELKKQKGLK